MSSLVKMFTLCKMDWRLENLWASDVDDQGVLDLSKIGHVVIIRGEKQDPTHFKSQFKMSVYRQFNMLNQINLVHVMFGIQWEISLDIAHELLKLSWCITINYYYLKALQCPNLYHSFLF